MRVDKTEKTMHIIQSVVALLIAAPFLLLLIVELKQDYPTNDSLIYEECTFIKYEYANERYVKYYRIYVEEYSVPLEIDNIVFDNVREKTISALKAGDKITISKENSDSTLYSISHNDDYIMSYDTYLEVHKENDKLGVLVCCGLACIGISLFAAEVVYYKKTRRALPGPRI